MILVFSLASALCLGVFARAQAIGDETARRETGAQIAQSGAELLKAGESLDQINLPEGYTLSFQPETGSLPAGLAAGEIQVCFEGEPVFSLRAAWQEAIP